MARRSDVALVSEPTRVLGGITVIDSRFVPGYKAPSTVDFLMNGPFDE